MSVLSYSSNHGSVAARRALMAAGNRPKAPDLQASTLVIHTAVCKVAAFPDYDSQMLKERECA